VDHIFDLLHSDVALLASVRLGSLERNSNGRRVPLEMRLTVYSLFECQILVDIWRFDFSTEVASLCILRSSVHHLSYC